MPLRMPPPTFAQLTVRAQIARLRALARTALASYPLRVERLRCINHGENTSFEVTARPEGASSRTRPDLFVLRIHRPGYQTPTRIRSELEWLDALRAETDVEAPVPVPSRSGDPLVTAGAPGAEDRHAILFRKVDGRFLQRGLNATALHRVGKLVATLHRHTRHFRPGERFERLRWDSDGLLGTEPIWGAATASSVGSARDRGTLARARDLLWPRVRALDEHDEEFGLIHADLHHGNYLFSGDRVRPIDFDDCGAGHFAYDMAVTLHALGPKGRGGPLRDAFLAGYRSVRSFPAAREPLLELFTAVRSVVSAGWIVSRSDNPRLRELVPQVLSRVAERLRELMPDLERHRRSRRSAALAPRST